MFNAIILISPTYFEQYIIKYWYPENWALSILCPIHKSESTNDLNNYRGVSLIDVLNKIVTGMIYNKLNNWAEENDKLDQSQ